VSCLWQVSNNVCKSGKKKDRVHQLPYDILEKALEEKALKELTQKYLIDIKEKLVTPRLCAICETVEVRDKYVIICKDCSRICFNMEAWLAPTR
jgi:hypothetical protein